MMAVAKAGYYCQVDGCRVLAVKPWEADVHRNLTGHALVWREPRKGEVRVGACHGLAREGLAGVWCLCNKLLQSQASLVEHLATVTAAAARKAETFQVHLYLRTMAAKAGEVWDIEPDDLVAWTEPGSPVTVRVQAWEHLEYALRCKTTVAEAAAFVLEHVRRGFLKRA